MHACVCVRMFVCVCVCTCVLYMHICVSVDACVVCVHIHMCMYVRTYPYTVSVCEKECLCLPAGTVCTTWISILCVQAHETWPAERWTFAVPPESAGHLGGSVDAGNSRSTGDKEGRSQSGQVHRTQSFTPSMVHDVVETYAVAFKPTGTVLSNHVAGW